MHQIMLILITIAVTCGCAAHPEPIIDTRGLNMALYDSDMADCETYGQLIKIEQGVVKGAAAGAAVGTATGAISGPQSRATDRCRRPGARSSSAGS